MNRTSTTLTVSAPGAPRTIARASRWASLWAVVLTSGGCVAVRSDDHGTPSDFSLGVTVSRPVGAEPTVETNPPDRPAWYLLEADGVLRVGLGARTDRLGAPPLFRTLSAADRAELWALARGAVAGRSWEAAPTEMPREGDDGVVIYLAGGDDHRTYRFGSGERSPQVDALVDRLHRHTGRAAD